MLGKVLFLWVAFKFYKLYNKNSRSWAFESRFLKLVADNKWLAEFHGS